MIEEEKKGCMICSHWSPCSWRYSIETFCSGSSSESFPSNIDHELLRRQALGFYGEHCKSFKKIKDT